MFKSILEYGFIQNAFVASILSSIACGIIGTIIIEKKLVMMSGGIAHTAFGGVGMGYFLKIEPIIGALIFSLLSSLGIAKLHRKSNTQTDILMGLFWSVGMAAGILFIAFTPGYPPDMSSYLFGDILTVTRFDLLLMLILDNIVILLTVLLFNALRAYMFDEEFLKANGIKIQYFDYLVFAMIAVTVVLLIRVVGIILILALLTAPAAIAKLFTKDLKTIMILSCILGMVFSITGLWISYEMRIASGAAIIMVCGISYLIAVSIGKKFVLRIGFII
ncbi:metal ABC transporter permease [Pseudobacteroides cellulosolvens]|uniref:ABC-type transporter, integral membrane subunit n=1 Tax=Pseudobacteroides cellulosolvens ATCC 35603 = DSM 2933 TaxID=398512 RepID=A0A0L6JUY1_9FIRM|nr:metal ABC transporter permease [Pseudobacteroides cellulosolvens]KNY29460.1 ABC-type transporter, integral membrane subunit [Pseudobacteroides cellulosolvens ATCC 35603 = DSM 2933]